MIKQWKMSATAKKLKNILTDRQNQVIKKDYPIRKERDRTIRLLVARGIKQKLLCELSGLSDSHISRIACGWKPKRKYD